MYDLMIADAVHGYWSGGGELFCRTLWIRGGFVGGKVCPAGLLLLLPTAIGATGAPDDVIEHHHHHHHHHWSVRR